jgi:hypothetical protein
MRPIPNARRPAKSILDRAFRYRPSHATDVRETFARARLELEQAKDSHPATARVVPLTRKEQQ